MDFYYRKNVVGIVQKIEDGILLYVPYRDIGHYELMEDLASGKESNAAWKTKRKYLLTVKPATQS